MIILQSDQRMFQIFKYTLLLHALCHIANFIVHPWVATDNIILKIIGWCGYISVIGITTILTIKSLQFFAQQHRKLIAQNKITGLLIESSMAICLMALIFFNQEFMAKFFNFILDLSRTTHSNGMNILLGAIGLYFCFELHEVLLMNHHAMQKASIIKKIQYQFLKLIVKICIISGIALGLIHPIAHILTMAQLQQFDAIIFNFTTSEFFLYIHRVMTIVLAVWLVIATYYGYTYFKRYKERK